VVHDIPVRLGFNERLPEKALVPIAGVLLPARCLSLLKMRFSFAASPRPIDIPQVQAFPPTTELASFDPELLLDPGCMVSQLLADVDLTELVEEQAEGDNGSKDAESNELTSLIWSMIPTCPSPVRRHPTRMTNPRESPKASLSSALSLIPGLF
jgi:hypothetical protein